MLDIGKFDRQIVLQNATVDSDDMGGQVLAWDESFRDWAHIEWKDGKSDENENQLHSTMSVEFTIRNNSDDQNSVNANNWRIAFPVNGGLVDPTKTQYYTVTGIKLWGGREKYKTLITELNTNEFITV